MQDAAPPRVVIERVSPELDGGRFAPKRVVGDSVSVSADVFADGHDQLAAVVRWRHASDPIWRETAMSPLGHDRWTAAFTVDRCGRFEFGIDAWVDAFASWRQALVKKTTTGRSVHAELLAGAALVRAAAQCATGDDAAWLRGQADLLDGTLGEPQRVSAALAQELAVRMARYPERAGATRYARGLALVVERERARSGAWYELFPRSCAPEPGRHGTLRDCTARLPSVARMGFDVVYLPPIHPIGRTHRKGRDNAPTAGPDDPGSPWAIGAVEGGHTAVHPDLGTLADFDALVARAGELGLEIALDLAFQCSPDHPWVREHPGWFRRRPDGSIQYAENPPKAYQDIFPLDFACEDWRALWQALLDVVRFWIAHGVRVFRVDNPHTKPFAFWEWLIARVREEQPEVVFLSEAFTRPRVLEYLAKLGFSQSYTYFTWRTSKWELETYVSALSSGPSAEYLRPNLFANTPDILPEHLQVDGAAMFRIRLVLAATLGSSYGIYGPPFELCVTEALPGTEEYRNSEKYEVRHWDVADPRSLAPLIARLNAARRDNPAFRFQDRLRFHPTDNPQILCYSRSTPDMANLVVVVVSLDPWNPQSGWLELPLADLGLAEHHPYQVHDLVGDARWLWQGPRNFVVLDPQGLPAHVFRVLSRLKTERDFDYWM